ncbi:hypothetical protein GF359_02175 [candidate division WOR-3 bacterium]|uniref:Uncharacterized protein n=1 Tax=candidate division WOR-3 bacterium TaxID=2052148 RepID=A0A9D5K9C0_UNCW3|nr:hypothetical protein [candidate division WOR-3 bacterium]MBD3364000.1 hypothetical protein [candidate division WOR-3 bacterium]
MARILNIKRPWAGLIVLILMLGVIGFAIFEHILSLKGKGLIKFSEDLKEVHFEGTYQVKAPGYDANLEIRKAGKGYALKWTFPNGRVYYGNGLQLGNLLGVAYDMGNDKTCGVAIYAKPNEELSGLWSIINDDKIYSERTIAATKIKVSSHELAGVYEFKGTNPNESTYEGQLTLKHTGATYEAKWVMEGERPVYGTLFSVDDVAVAGYQDPMGIKITVYEIKGNTLEGEWLYTTYDRLTELSDLRPGTEKAVKSK